MVMGDSTKIAGSGHSTSSRDLLQVAARARLRDRIRVRVWGRPLDRALAAGVPAESSPALALRARFLIAMPQRRVMAASYRRLLGEGSDAGAASKRPSAGCRSRIVAANTALSALADTLGQAGPVAAGGAAQAWLLLGDGTGPLYNSLSPADLRARAVVAERNLRLPPVDQITAS
jgi:hypothetical protein